MDFDPQPGDLFEYNLELRLHLVRDLIHINTGDFVVFLESQAAYSKIYLIKQSRNGWITTENLRLGFTAHLTK